MSSAPLVRASMVRWSMVGFSGCSGLGGTGGVSILTMSGSVLGVACPEKSFRSYRYLSWFCSASTASCGPTKLLSDTQPSKTSRAQACDKLRQ